MVTSSKNAIVKQFIIKEVCSQCGYVKHFAERTCPECGGTIISKVVKRESYRKVILA